MRVHDIPLRQILYHSRAVGGVDIDRILSSAKRNNGLDGITGVLLFAGGSFLQVLEGPDTSVDAAFARIRSDARHADVEVVSDRQVAEREFAYWSMERLDASDTSDELVWRLRRRLEQFSPDLHHYFFEAVAAPGGERINGT